MLLQDNQIFNPENLGFRLKSWRNDAGGAAFVGDFRG